GTASHCRCHRGSLLSATRNDGRTTRKPRVRDLPSPDDHLLEAMLVLQRKFLTLHRIVHPQLDILGALSSGRFAEIEAADLAYFRDVYDHLERISDRIQIAREMINGAMQCYLSHVSNKTNMVMKGLTILATVVLPATLLTSIWGMNVTA